MTDKNLHFEVIYNPSDDILFISCLGYCEGELFLHESSEFLMPEPGIVITVVKDPVTGKKFVGSIALLEASHNPIWGSLFSALNSCVASPRPLNLVIRTDLFRTKKKEEKNERNKRHERRWKGNNGDSR